MALSDKDLDKLKTMGIDETEVSKQIEKFKSGISYLNIVRAATPGYGIMTLSETKVEKFVAKYEKCLPEKKLTKFVPASGAATRMFKHLFEFVNSYSASEEDYLNLLVDRGPDSMFYFFENLDQFAFFSDLRLHFFNQNIDLPDLMDKKEYLKIILGVLYEDGLNYGKLPKGLIKFHKYVDFSRTAAEEHMVEGTNYCKNSNNHVCIHFTVSPDSMELFKKHINSVIPIIEERYNVKYEISFSVQNSATDTIAVDMDNNPFRNEDNSLELRPGGHGALIENLNNLNADLIFIKNIDNIVPDRTKFFTALYKKTLAGILLSTQDSIFRYLEILDKDNVPEDQLNTILKFIEKDLYVKPSTEFDSFTYKDKLKYTRMKLNRPIRVCSMVKNEGEPGGGPYLATNHDGTVSLQIIEYSQIDVNNPKQLDIVMNSTHFNPVDMVCSIKNYKGKKFNLKQFIDQDTGFISIKSKNGKSLKAYELPGLWNGGMSDWNTIFVEMPVETFNPVKVVNDLLKEEHRTYEQ